VLGCFFLFGGQISVAFSTLSAFFETIYQIVSFDAQLCAFAHFDERFTFVFF